MCQKKPDFRSVWWLMLGCTSCYMSYTFYISMYFNFTKIKNYFNIAPIKKTEICYPVFLCLYCFSESHKK